MNYYQFHIGDYARDTGHLSNTEDLAYRRMLDRYYANERPLPADRGVLCRLIRMTSDDERRAVDNVAAEFFVERNGHLVSKRCDRELSKARGTTEKARASANARWERKKRHANALPPQCEGNAPNTQYPIPTTTSKEKASAELSLDAPPQGSSIAIGLLTNTGAEYPITQTQVENWTRLFPAVDVMQALRSMAAWLQANKSERKTASGMERFVVRWLTKDQNRGGSRAPDAPLVNGAAAAWEKLRAAARDQKQTDDPAVNAIIQTWGGLRTIGSITVFELNGRRREFEKLYYEGVRAHG